MEDFYTILGLDNSADMAKIRAAYKKLAKKYHPDCNPGDPSAEEMFKKINEAYRILSDPFKKFQYDNRFSTWVDQQTVVDEDWREMNRKRYYQWQHTQQSRYKFDKEYFKIQGLAFLVFIVISGFCFAIIHTANHYYHKKNMERWTANSQSLKKVNALFIEGKVDDAFNMIETLRQKDPLEFRFSFAHDSLVSELRNMADEKFNQKDFPAAVIYYMALKNHEEPVRFETVRKISLCQYYLGNFKESLQSLKHLHNQRPGDMELVYQIGIINLEKLDNPQEALYYFSLGKKLFKENLTKVYGEAFEVVMDPADAPDIYYEVFRARARTNLMLNNFDDAVKDCNWAIYLRPYKPDPFKMRAQANLRLKKMDNICFDLHQARKYGANDVDLQLRKHCY